MVRGKRGRERKCVCVYRCNCNDGGQAILEALTPLPTRALLAGLGQACGQPQTVSLCI